jgi:hypothetical protein
MIGREVLDPNHDGEPPRKQSADINKQGGASLPLQMYSSVEDQRSSQ